ncbi:MAG: TldD/PmbA family protein [Dictyoglomus turgidum]
MNVGYLFRFIESLKKQKIDCEVFFQEKEKNTLIISRQEVENYQTSKEYGIGVRVIKEGKHGFAYTTNLEELNEIIQKAIEVSQIMEEDRNWQFSKELILKDTKCYPEEPSLQEKISRLLELEREIYSKDKRIKTVRNVVWEKTHENNKILSTTGLFLEYNQQYQYVYTEVGASDGINERSGFDFDVARSWQELELDKLVDKVVWQATSLLGASPKRTQSVDIILPMERAGEFLELISELFSADNVQKGKSILKGFLGERVASSVLNIIEDPFCGEALVPRAFDDEGMKTCRKYFVRNGILENYAYNIYTANKEGKISTGNGVRGSFKALPQVGYFNLYIEPGEKSERELIESVRNGVYVISLMGLHLADTISGDFSLGIEGLWIRNGEFLDPVAEMTISGNLKDFLKNISGIGNKLNFKGNINSPMLKLEDIILAGK